MSSHKLAKHENAIRRSKPYSKVCVEVIECSDDVQPRYPWSVEALNLQQPFKSLQVTRKRKLWDIGSTNNSAGYHMSSLPNYVMMTNHLDSHYKSSDDVIREKSDHNHEDAQKEGSSSDDVDSSEDRAPSSGNMWKLEDVDGGLAADFEDSLSGLGVDVTSTTYNMSDSLLQSLPSVSMMKHDSAQKHSEDNHGSVDHLLPYDPNNHHEQSNYPNHQFNSHSYLSSSSLHHQLIQQNGLSSHPMCTPKRNACTRGGSQVSVSPPASDCVDTGNGLLIRRFCRNFLGAAGITRSESSPCVVFSGASSGSPIPSENGNVDSTAAQPKFQYILAAATSIISKFNEEPITYLNQGQPYEIIFKSLNCQGLDLTGKYFQSTIRVGFAERRLQYSEKEQIAAWRMARPNDRILEIDLPLSYGVLEVSQDPSQLNMCSVIWSPSKDVGIYIRVNSISTEFTAKKHGGEKGVPFQILIETWNYQETNLMRLHAASCQIKVFKLKGAERKHKQDRDKLMKQSQQERDKYQPSFSNTVLFDTPVDALINSTKEQRYESKSFLDLSSKSDVGSYSFNFDCKTSIECFSSTMTHPTMTTCSSQGSPPSLLESSKVNGICSSNMSLSEGPKSKVNHVGLKPTASPEMASDWLVANRFGQYCQIFVNFCGMDLLRLLRDDLVQICGLADGIRLYNALHAKTVQPLLTLYVCFERSGVYQAIYLEALAVDHLLEQIKTVLHIQDPSITNLYCQGPGGCHVLVTDQVVQNMSTESLFSVKNLHGENCNPGLLLVSI